MQRAPSDAAGCAISPITLGHGLNGSLTAPVERALLYRARSWSTRGPSAQHRRLMMMNQTDIRPENTHAEPSGELEREKQS